MSSLFSDDEKKLIDCVAKGEWADFQKAESAGGLPTTKPAIQADLVRRLILGIPLPTDSHASKVNPTPTPQGVRIRGAQITGLLDLADGEVCAGGDCKTLVLDNCELPGKEQEAESGSPYQLSIDARHIRLKRLSITNCKFYGADLTGVSLDGDFDFSGAKPFKDDGACWVVARDARIDGTIRAAHVTLNRPDTKPVHVDQQYEYALDLQGAEVMGSLIFFPEFVAKGGVGLSKAQISGNLWMLGANISVQDPDRPALSAQMAMIDGVLAFRTCEKDENINQAKSEGELDFYQASVGVLDLSGAQVSSVNAHMIKIRGDLLLGAFSNDFQSSSSLLSIPLRAGNIVLSNASIGGNAFIYGARVHSLQGRHLSIHGDLKILSSDIPAIDAPHLIIRGDMVLDGTFRQLELSEACIDGSLELGAYEDFAQAGVFRVELEELPTNDVQRPQLLFRSSKIGRLWVPAEIRLQQIPKSKPTAIRTRQLECYKGWKLGEALYEKREDTENTENAENTEKKKNTEYLIASFLINEDTSWIIVLTGASNPIHWFNRMTELNLISKNQVMDYLRFFCANVWGGKDGENGPFRIIEPGSIRPEDGAIETHAKQLTVLSEQAPWKATASLVYAGHVFEAAFEISKDGTVLMTGDRSVGEINPDEVAYKPPFRRRKNTLGDRTSNGGSKWPQSPIIPGSWDDNPSQTLEEVLKALNALADAQTASKPSSNSKLKVRIDLRGANVGLLDDSYRDSWGENVQLDLDNFVYDDFLPLHPDRASSTKPKIVTAITTPKSATGPFAISTRTQGPHPVIGREEDIKNDRLKWLERQYDGSPKPAEFTPQSYELLTRHLRRMGLHDAADWITVMKHRVHRNVSLVALIETLPRREQLGYLWSIFRREPIIEIIKRVTVVPKRLLDFVMESLFDLLFRYGLSIPRALIVCFFYILIGYVGVEIANYGYVHYPPILGVAERPTPDWVPSFMRRAPRTIPVLVIDSTPVSALILNDQTSPGAATARPVSQRTSDPQAVVEEVACREQVDSLWYAVDVAIPLLDLKQESKCMMSTRADSSLWRVAKQMYASIGAIITAITILTVSGILRRVMDSRS